MRAYRETFKKHRILFCLPPLLIAVALGFLTFSTPVKYQSIASLWIDNGPLGQSSLNGSSGTQPSGSEQTLLNELLATKNFDLDVANASSLKKYFQSNGVGKQQLPASLAASVASGVTSSAPGPQILTLAFTGPTPEVSESTLQSLITHLQGAASYYGSTFAQTAQTYFQGQVKTSSAAVSRTTAAVNAYKQTHPSSNVNNDQAYAALVAAQQSASSQLASATSSLNQASSQTNGAGTSAMVREVDAPSVPTSPTAGKKAALMKVAGGFFGGMLLSLIIIVAMTPSREDRWDAEMSDEWQVDGLVPAKPAGQFLTAHTGGGSRSAQGSEAAADGLVPAPPPREWASERRFVMPREVPGPDRTESSSESISDEEVPFLADAQRRARAAFGRGVAS